MLLLELLVNVKCLRSSLIHKTCVLIVAFKISTAETKFLSSTLKSKMITFIFKFKVMQFCIIQCV